jgi:putative ABC transport system permease protein
MVLKEGLILSLIGIPLGIISSIIGIGITLSVVNGLGIFEEFYETKLTLTVSSMSILVTVFFGGLTIFLSSLIPALKASRTSPIDAIRLSNDIKIKGKKLRTPKFIRKIFGIEGELGLKNMKRNRKKYRSTIISLFVSIVLFMAVNGFAEYSLRSTLKLYNDYNFNVGIINLNNMSYSDIKKDITKLDYVDKYTITNTINSALYVDEKDLNKQVIVDMKQNNYDTSKQKYMVNIKLSTLGDEEFKRYVKEIGGNLQDYLDPTHPRIIMIDKSNFYSQQQGKYYQITLTNLKENEEIILNNDTIVNKMKIDKITSTYPIGFNNADSNIQSIQCFISNKVYDSLDNSLKSADTMVLMQSDKPDKLVDEIETLGNEKGIDFNVQNIQEQVQMLNNVVLAISIFLYGFIALVSLITITNVINTITTSIYLRRREFATLKAIGMTNKDFNKMIRFESIFYGLKSLLYGLPIGILLDYFMYKNIRNLFIYDYVLPYKPIFVCICFDFIIIAITMAYSIRKIRNDNIIDVIKQENL